MSKPGYDNQAFDSGGGDVVIPLEAVQDSGRERLTYSWSNINVYAESQKQGCRKSKGVVQEKHILKNVSGICRPGELLAIMGASGAGKTTLLNVLTNRSSSALRIEGEMYMNGAVVDPSKLTKKSAYVQQEDLFIGVLTVKESLIFQATLRMDKNIPQKQRLARVEEVMIELGLTKCSDTLVGIPGRLKGISGGEMKRLAFACEVLTDPPLMFCDEPTSGLDSFMAQNIVEVMKDLATRFNKCIISTIHQPSSEVFALFDRVLLMAEGRVAFLGYTSDAIKFLHSMGRPCPENFNPADFFISTLAIQPGQEDECRQWVDKICDTFSVSEKGKDMEEAIKVNMETKENTSDLLNTTKESKSPYKASWGAQFSAVFKRAWLENIREPMILRVKLLQTIMTALLVGIIYLGQDLTQDGVSNISGALFLIITNMTFQNTFGTVNTFCTQIPIYLREHFNGMYRCDVYFLAKNLAELPLACIQPVIFTSIIYYMVGFYDDVGTFFVCMGISTLIANTAGSFGYMVSCMSSSVEMALAIAAPLIIPFMLFGGFFLNSETVPVYLIWMKYISWFYYGNEALNINQWKDVEEIDGCDTDLTTYMPSTPDWTETETALSSLSSSLLASSSPMAMALSDAGSSLANAVTGGLTDIALPTFPPNYTLPTQPPSNGFKVCNGTEVLSQLGFHEEDFYLDIGILFVLLVAMRALAFLFLFMKSKK
ncbi:unnamed protein product [Meganyctiphanes norvegica]|uniref:Protein white n=1 Tax=Meganyctiphanes norvegica TaxID=48144 RepID=A0AAV2R8N1_MEGNR